VDDMPSGASGGSCAITFDDLENFIYQSYDGFGNNLSSMSQPRSTRTVEFPSLEFGCSNRHLGRFSESAYEDGVSSLPRTSVNPRSVSNAVCIEDDPPVLNSQRLSDMFWLWGQFVDHELDLTRDNQETIMIPVPNDDPIVESRGAMIPFHRSNFDTESNPREQINSISSYLDSTNVYGSSSSRAMMLRMMDGSGKLQTQLSSNNEVILHDAPAGFEMAAGPVSSQTMLAAGDIRANENVLLSGIHTLLVREHNRLCDELLESHPHWLNNDDKLYNEARKIVVALDQHITYNEFLPLLLGEGAIPEYSGYKPDVNSTINTEFSTVAYRVGHSMLSSNLHVEPGDDILLRTAYFNPDYVRTNGIDALLNGAMNQIMKEVDTKIVEDVRSHLFVTPNGSMLIDLAVLNMQRARDHGIPDYNSLRVAYGLTARTSFSEISSNTDINNALESVYGADINIVDPWVAGLAEDHVNGGQVGELFYAILRDQFIRLRDGDRFWYENDPTLSDEKKTEIKNTTLADVIRRNTSITNVRDNVFVVPE